MNRSPADNVGDKRQQIIEAAVIVFARNGFHQARVEEIAERAGVGKGTVYEYFSSKKELFQEMLVTVTEQYQRAFEQEVRQAGSLREKLKVMLQVNFDFLEGHRDMARLLLSDHPPLPDDICLLFRESQQRNIKNFMTILEQAVQSGEIRKINCSLGAQIIFGTLMTSGGQILFTDEPLDIEGVVDQLVDILINGLK